MAITKKIISDLRLALMSRGYLATSLFLFFALISNVNAIKIFDGKPKIIFHGNGQSWKINKALDEKALDLAGIDQAFRQR